MSLDTIPALMAKARTQESHSTQDIVALGLLVLGGLLFLALISYSPQDRSWLGLNSVSPPNKNTQNFVGALGSTLAGASYIFLGAASYLLAAALIAYGFTGIVGRMMGFALRPIWLAMFVVSGACLVHVLGLSVIDRHKMNIGSEGGIVGHYLGGEVFKTVLGSVGSVVVLGFFYVASIILMTGLNPIAVLRRSLLLPGEWFDKYHDWKMERADEAQRLSLQHEKLERQRVKLERQLGRRPRPSVANEAEDQAELSLPDEPVALPEPERPAPQIFDSTAANPQKKAKKSDKTRLMATIASEGYELPSIELLDAPDESDRPAANPDELLSIQTQIIETLAEFGIVVSAGDITRGPTITRYEVYPARGVRVDRVVSYERDIARATCAERINILAPIPGKDTVGIEIANSKKQKVALRELLETEDFMNSKARIPIALGKDVYGKTIIADLAAMPHGLVAGTTGSGKSVCINAILASILYRFSPADLRLILIDPKVVEMQMYNTLPHLVVPVVTDPKKVLLALRWAVNEMEKRYAIFAKTGVRNIQTFNSRPKPKSQRELDAERGEAGIPQAANIDQKRASIAIDPDAEPDVASSEDILGKTFGEESVVNADAELYGTPTSEMTELEQIESERRELQGQLGIKVPRDDGIEVPETMPFIVIIIDELADLMQTAPADVESAIARITQKARAAGIHMIIATQTPRADVITGVIKANVPCRVAFQVASPLDSRVILDENGAERLLGMGDLLYRPPGTSKLIRAQGVLVTDEEVKRVVDFASAQSEQCFENDIHQKLENARGGDEGEEEVSDEDEELVEKCIEVMRQEKKASTSLFQRRLRLGYTRAARILDILEERGFVAPGDGAKPREILRDLDAL